MTFEGELGHKTELEYYLVLKLTDVALKSVS